jgi:hypothetical protein
MLKALTIEPLVRPGPYPVSSATKRRRKCQVGVFLIGVTPARSALLDHQLFLPESRRKSPRRAKARRHAAPIPGHVTLRTKPQIAAELIRNVAVLILEILHGKMLDHVHVTLGGVPVANKQKTALSRGSPRPERAERRLAEVLAHHGEVQLGRFLMKIML